MMRGRRSAFGRWVHAVVALSVVAALLAVQPAAAQTGGGAEEARSADLAEVRAWAEDNGVFDEPRSHNGTQGLRFAETVQQARTSGAQVPRAITDCNSSVYADDVGEVPHNDIEETGTFGDCRFTMIDAFTVDPIDIDEFFAFGGYFDEDQNDDTGCNGYDFVVVTFDLEGDNAFVQEQPTCDSSTWFIRPEIPVSVLATPSVPDINAGYISLLFQTSFLLGGEGSYEWFQILQSDTVVDFNPPVVDFVETLVPITPAAPTGVTASPASGGGATLAWDHTGGDTTGFEIQWRDASAAPASAPLAGDAPPPPPVVGGGPISINQAPWSVALFPTGTNPAATTNCGGVLVSPVKVITAAHCVDTELPEDIEVLAGQTDLSLALESQISTVLSIEVYPGYVRSPVQGDVAVLSLAEPFNNLSTFPRLNTNPNVPVAGTPATVSGWGAVDDGSGGLTFTNDLQGASMFVLAGPGQSCGDWPATLFFSEHHVCAGVSGGGVDSCFGDSGGGLITTDGVNFDLVGIVSFGNGACGAAEFPGAYSRVSTYAAWLNAAIAAPAWTGQAVACTGSRCSYQVPDLVPGRRYEFRVAGVNDAGVGPWSASVFTTGGDLICLGRTVTIVAEEGTITVGTSGDDVIWGTQGNDDIRSGAGNDRVCANGGDDRVTAGAGNDVVSAGPGNDNVSGGRGADTVTGGSGNDLIRGQGGRDRLNGGGGADEIDGGTGSDTIKGQGGRDRLIGGKGSDRLSGGNGNDNLDGRGGDDRLNGQGGRDRLTGGPGTDVCNGGRGNDRPDAATCESIS